MKTLRLCGWAVIFTVTLLLAACANQPSKVAITDTLSGPDATMTQLEEQKQDLELRENALAINLAWQNEHERLLNRRTDNLERRENALAINNAWVNERETLLNRRTENLERRENALAINQAWLNERETRLAQQAPDLTKQEDMMAFRKAFHGDRAASSIKLAGADREAFQSDRVASSIKLAGADSVSAESATVPYVASTITTEDPGSYAIRHEQGRCYAKVVFPAEYKTVAVIKPIEVPKGENLPVLYQTVTEKVKVTDEQMRWEEVLCEDSLTPCRITEVQRALYRGGYNPGPIDGIVGQQTMAAINAFQSDYDLTVTNHLTIETVRALDANF